MLQNNLVSEEPQFGEAQTVKLAAIIDSKVTETRKNSKGEDFVIAYPYEITINNSEGKSIFTEAVRGVFYWTDGMIYENKGFLNFSRNHALHAVKEIMKSKAPAAYAKCKVEGKLDLNKMIGYEFEAIISVGGFIDWYKTLKHNNVDMPDFEPKTTVATEAPVAVAAPTQTDGSDLPF